MTILWWHIGVSSLMIISSDRMIACIVHAYWPANMRHVYRALHSNMDSYIYYIIMKVTAKMEINPWTYLMLIPTEFLPHSLTSVPFQQKPSTLQRCHGKTDRNPKRQLSSAKISTRHSGLHTGSTIHTECDNQRYTGLIWHNDPARCHQCLGHAAITRPETLHKPAEDVYQAQPPWERCP